MSDYLFLGFGLLAAVFAVTVARVWKPRVPQQVSLGCGIGALFVSAYFLFGIETGTSVPADAGISPVFTGGTVLFGALLLLGGVLARPSGQLGAGLQVIGSLLLLIVFAVPSALLLAAPLFGLVAISSVNHWLANDPGHPPSNLTGHAALLAIGVVAVATAVGSLSLAGGGNELVGKQADIANALRMVDEQIAVFDQAGVKKTDERYQELVRQRQTILESASKTPTPVDEAVAALGGHQPATEVPNAVGVCEAIPGIKFEIDHPIRCLSIGRGVEAYLNVYLGSKGEAVIISHLATTGPIPRDERQSIPVIPDLATAQISIDADDVIHIITNGVEIEIPTVDWAKDTNTPPN